MIEKNHIYCGNALELIKGIRDNSIHLIVTSPPYNCNIPYDSYDDNMDIDKYFFTMGRIFIDLYEKLVKGGRCAVNIPECIQIKSGEIIFLSPRFQHLFNNAGFITREIITWVKGYNENHFQGNNTAWGSWCSPSNPYMRSLTEKIIVLSKETLELKGEKTDLKPNEFKEWTKNCWFIPTNKDTKHPAVFPIELVKRLIKLYSWIGNTVLDPFNGIGTTTFTARQLNRDYIGMDLSENYCNIARKKLQQEVLNYD